MAYLPTEQMAEGSLIVEIDRRRSERGRLEVETRRLDNRIKELEAALVKRAMPDADSRRLTYEHWECATSPTGSCVYDIDADPSEDDCLFCHDPRERK